MPHETFYSCLDIGMAEMRLILMKNAHHLHLELLCSRSLHPLLALVYQVRDDLILTTDIISDSAVITACVSRAQVGNAILGSLQQATHMSRAPPGNVQL